MRRSKALMYVTAGLTGGALALLAQYCHVPLYLRIPCYVAMGIAIHIAWFIRDKPNKKGQ